MICNRFYIILMPFLGINGWKYKITTLTFHRCITNKIVHTNIHKCILTIFRTLYITNVNLVPEWTTPLARWWQWLTLFAVHVFVRWYVCSCTNCNLTIFTIYRLIIQLLQRTHSSHSHTLFPFHCLRCRCRSGANDATTVDCTRGHIGAAHISVYVSVDRHDGWVCVCLVVSNVIFELTPTNAKCIASEMAPAGSEPCWICVRAT